MKSRTRNNSFSEYAKKCRELQRDLQHILSDLEFVQEQGGQIRYAVDFSEIFAYALPSRTTEEFALFAEDSKEWTDSLHRLALRRLFNELPEKLIFLKPYIIETQRFLQYQERQAYVLLGKVPEMYKERERLKNSSEFLQIKEFDIDKKVERGIPLTPEERKKVVNFLQRTEALSFLTFIDWQGAIPKKRIRDLIEAQRFENLEDLIEVDGDFIRQVDQSWEDWYEMIAKLRSIESQNAASLDATALATVEQANYVLEQQEQKRKLLLVTRSQTMHNSFAQLSSPSVERHGDSGLLRHPRIFSFSIKDIPLVETRRQLHDELVELREKVDTFLEEFVKHEDSDIDESPGIKFQLDTLLSKLKEAWHSTMALLASLQQAALHEANDSSEQNPGEIQAILQLLQSDERLQDLIVSRLKELTDDLAQGHLQLGGYAQGTDREQQEFLVDYLVAKDFDTKIVVEVSKTPLLHQLPYSLEFYTGEANQLLRNFFSADGDSDSRIKPRRRDVAAFFQQGLSMSAQYEPLLVIAYVLGASRRWRLAEKYCEWALDIVSKASDEVLEHEGKFLLAVCMRKNSPSVTRHRRAIRLLDEAIDLKDKHEDGAKPDPRYLKEKALHILLLNTDWMAGDDRDFPHPDEALELLDRAYKTCTNDPVLRMRIVCDRLYYFVETGQIAKREAQVKKDYFELIKLQKKIEPDDREWPTFVIDTIAWTRWNLFDDAGSTSEKRIVMNQLRQAIYDSEGKDRIRCQRHLNAVKQGKKRQNWIAIWAAKGEW